MSESETSESSTRNTAGTERGPASRLELVGITKRYPAVVANDRIDLAVAPGEIHAVLGENGAGKSTLMKIIYGAIRPDAGELWWDGAPVVIESPAAARQRGIAMVFQHFALFETLTVLENVWLGLDTKQSRAELRGHLLTVARDHGLDLPLDTAVHDLSVGERQRVEIVRALLTGPRLLILDEPTSVLTPQAAERLFVTLREIAAGGCSILYISHKLDEVRALCQRCTVLRAGRVTGVVDPRGETNQSLAELMLGAAPSRPTRPASPASPPASLPGTAASARASAVALEVRGLSLPARTAHATVALADVSFRVAGGEVLGIAGISGNGQADLLDALSGEDRRAPPGTVWLSGQDISRASPRQRRASGLRYIPEERIGHGAVPNLPLTGNTLLTRDELVTRGGWIARAPARQLAARLIERGGVKAGGPDAPAGTLSGGNLQKFIVSREIDAAPAVLVVAQPTWGLDVGAAARIRGELMALAQHGSAVLVVSEDLDELFEIASALLVIARGRLSPRVPVAGASITQIGEWMGGAGL
jgi:simple sugar transport system ATP-binding protein